MMLASTAVMASKRSPLKRYVRWVMSLSVTRRLDPLELPAHAGGCWPWWVLAADGSSRVWNSAWLARSRASRRGCRYSTDHSSLSQSSVNKQSGCCSEHGQGGRQLAVHLPVDVRHPAAQLVQCFVSLVTIELPPAWRRAWPVDLGLAIVVRQDLSHFRGQ